MADLEINQLHYGDNLKVLKEKIPSEIADLIYLDPPFNSSRNYNLLFKQVQGDSSPAQIMAFEDTWTWSPMLYQEFREDPKNAPLFHLVAALFEILGTSEMMAYILMMAPRILELHRKLKPTGSLYLHCDPTASHYLKLLLDCVFGARNFRNEIVWKRTNVHNDSKTWSKVNDVILFYSKTDDFTWNPQYSKHSAEYLVSKYRQNGNDGRGAYMLDNMTSPNPRKNMMYEWKGFPFPPNGWRYSRDTMAQLDGNGRIWYPTHPDGTHDTSKRPRLKRYLEDSAGTIFGTNWTDINPINSQAKERRGYPTQKPLPLLERIIAASSNEGDVILDPFAGCGTAIVAAERMDRKWIGIDITYLAISEVVYRLNAEKVVDKPLKYKLVGTPVDSDGAAKLFEQTKPQNHKPFEQFCVSLVAGEYREKMGADRGIDGLIHLWDFEGKLRKIVIQVKGGNALTLSAVRDFASVIKDNDAVMGLMISMREQTPEMKLVAEQQGFAEWPSQRKYPKMQIRTVKQLLESPREPFEVPDSARIPRAQGVGKLQRNKQLGLEFAEED